MSFRKRIVFKNRFNKKVMVRHIIFNEDNLTITTTDVPNYAKYFTNEDYAMLVCRIIDEVENVHTMLEDCKQVFVITNVKRDSDKYLRTIVKRDDNTPVPAWTTDITDAMTFTSFDSMAILCNFIDAFRERDTQAKCGHQMIYK
ncbi:gp39 [Listeria phage P35]|uniref:Uncharacterized protein n=1 Tax=Listeria phage LP-083-1 TaxID=1458854 RepID=A0A059T6H5_9CAUD|nr:gp39 [Listeria phage P35]AAY53224.1 gp39 [Listeria phage P35]AHL19004.1 hypothetical protein LP083-1_039 [Listeria phage LP-083-1]